MHHLSVRFATLLASVTAAVSGLQIRADDTADCVDYSELALKLSGTAQIYVSGTETFDDLVERWSNASTPVANVVVVPGNENDVVETVLFANGNSLPFLATNGYHGSITTLGGMTSGIEIHLSQLSNISISADGTTATIGGGVISHNLTETLWAAGKQTVTGTCECVSYLGPGLGGGHGWLQGRHGLISDQFVSWNVVLANGTLITVDENSDLYWGMKGAGHNFGIVTSMTSKVYDIVYPNYGLETLIFSGDQVEDVYRVANEQWLDGNKTMPIDLINWSYWFYDPTTSDKPVIQFFLIQEGVDTVDDVYKQPFLDLGTLSNTSTSGTYLDLGAWTGIDLSAGPCQKTGNANPRFPIYLKSYNTTAQAQVYDIFADATTNSSGTFAGALFMFEGYSQQGVKSFSDDATAYAYRADNLLVAPLLTYAPSAANEELAYELGNQIRDVLYAGSGETSLNTYVNYAYGDETAKAWYGDEAWRQERLQSLKAEYDPSGKFSFYAPIA